MGVHFDENLTNGRAGIYTFRAQGCIYHNIGSLLPKEGDRPRFLQLYTHARVCIYEYMILTMKSRIE